MNPEDAAKKRLFGRRVQNKDIASYVANALLGSAGRPPMNLSEIQRKLGYKDPKSVRQFRDLALDLGLLEKDAEGRIHRRNRTREFNAFLENDAFAKHEAIAPWIESMMNRKQGRPLKIMRGRITTFRKLCNLLSVDPEYWIAPGNSAEVLKHAAATMQGFNADLQSGKVPIRQGSNPTTVLYRYVGVLRDFLAYHGYTFPRGSSGVMGQKASMFHGKYADVKFTSDQLESVLASIRAGPGVDSDLYRAFAFGIQSCARRRALIGTELDTMEETTSKAGNPLLIVKVFESKTEHKNSGIWKKVIAWPETQEAIKRQAKKSKYLLDGRTPAAVQKLADQLREEYKKANPARLDYFLEHPFHTLRHCGAHYWLQRCNYNHSLVADIGGWFTTDELKNSYGAIPEDHVYGALGL